jgi:2-methylcitrate dehydratase PrpD
MVQDASILGHATVLEPSNQGRHGPLGILHMATISEIIAEFVTDLGFGDLPSSVVSRTKELVLDHLGVAAFGATTPWGTGVAKTMRALGGIGESSIYFASDKVPALNAAFVNGTFAHGFELDDHYQGAHSACVVIPSAMAVGQKQRSDGRALITAIVAGYEILARLARAMPHISDRGHHTTGTLGPFGSAVAAGKILGMQQDRLVAALGIAGNFPTGVCEFYKGTMEKRVFAGRAAQSGVLACLLADAGITGAKTIFEGEVGFCHAFSDHPDLKEMTAGLGEKFYTEDVYLKRYPCAGTNHPYIDAALSLYEKHNKAIAREDGIAEIIIEGGKKYRGKEILSRRRTAAEVQDVMGAQYSIPYAVAVTLHRGRPGVEEFSQHTIKDAKLQRLLGKCRIVKREKFSGMGRLTLKFNNGLKVAQEVVDTNLPIGKIGQNAVTAKFLTLCSHLPENKRAEKIANTVRSLEELANVNELVNMLTVRTGAGRAVRVPARDALSTQRTEERAR